MMGIPVVVFMLMFTTKKLDDDSFSYLLLYVDGMLVVRRASKVNDLKSLLGRQFNMDLGEDKKIPCIKIHGDWKVGKLVLSKKKYICRVLYMFNISDSKLVSTPLVVYFKLSTP